MKTGNIAEVEPAKPICLTTKDAAKVLGVEPKTMANWRNLGTGPAYIHTTDSPKSPVLYLYEDLYAWARGRKVVGGVE